MTDYMESDQAEIAQINRANYRSKSDHDIQNDSFEGIKIKASDMPNET